jgi:hypothetical protein
MFSVQRSDRLDCSGLHWIARFGWLRMLELGSLLWPEPGDRSGELHDEARATLAQRKAAAKLAARWKAKRWVLYRQLPRNAGTALVLTAAGARFLRDKLGVAARAGDSWGRTVDGSWRPPNSWEHELLATLLLTQFIEPGREIKTEREIRTENPGLRKYPDGLIRLFSDGKDGQTKESVIWVEVESAEKSGAKMLALARALTLVSRHTAPTLSGWQPRQSMVAFRADLVDLANRPINHRHRIKMALQRHIGADIPVYFVELNLRNSAYHLTSITTKSETVQALTLGHDEAHSGRSAFHSNERNEFVNYSVDREGQVWTLKVYAIYDRWRYEIWDSQGPLEGNHQPRLGYQTERLEDAFRIALQQWRAKFY